MKKTIISLIFLILLCSLLSAEIVITQQPGDVYNLGDVISIPITVKSIDNPITGIFEMFLICRGIQINYYKNDIHLLEGEEKRIDSSLILTKERIKEINGNCKIKASLKEKYIMTKDFKISNLINLQVTSTQTEFEPGKDLIIRGNAIKENKKDSKGFIELTFSGNSTIDLTQLETINNGFFTINIPLPKNMKSGAHTILLTAYEKNQEGEKTNQGSNTLNINVKQIPTTLELIFENQEIEPGTDMLVKTILKDQTGESIISSSTITIKNKKGEILEHIEKPTEENLIFPIAYNEPPTNWTIIAYSNELQIESDFNILEKEDIEIELINDTLVAKNIGNIPYNQTALIKINNESLHLDIYLKIDEIKEFILTAQKGEHDIEIMTHTGNTITGKAIFTGKAIDIKEVQKKFMKYPLIWIFIILILGFILFIIFKKGLRKAIFGKFKNKKKQTSKENPWPNTQQVNSQYNNSLINTRNKANLSLSIKGDKQNVSIICLKLKNLKEILSKKTNVKETIQKIINIAEKNKIIAYENQENLFFILAPIKTKTFKNEKNAVDFAQDIQEILKEHNKLFKQKINFGISLNYGSIIARTEKEGIEFMSMGTLITTSKKIASISNEEILLSEKINDKLKLDLKTEKHKKENILVYTIKEIKNREDNKKFIKSFLNRVEEK